ncbi:hypothetical protein C5C86_13425 [Rathayibacter sp. AY1E4]|nr:hypothetical protein C5C44_13965 [Rathayibacter sp. AY1F6]PPH40031.1 hypothetical protein C5C86_13425 [Rathayibacter sp. AY1E4]
MIVVLITWLKLHPFVSLLIGALTTGLIAGLAAARRAGRRVGVMSVLGRADGQRPAFVRHNLRVSRSCPKIGRGATPAMAG